MAKGARSKRESSADDAGAARQAILKEKYEASLSAFKSWKTSQARTDQHLHTAIGQLAEFAAAVGNDHQVLVEFAADKGVRATKASSSFTIVVKLIADDDRKKASKYATVLKFAAERGIEQTAESVANFIKAEGGIEACLRSFRELPRKADSAKRGGRPSAFKKALERIGGIAKIATPSGLELAELSGDYFLVLGTRDADGTTHLLPQPVTDEKAVRRAISVIAPKSNS